MPALRFLDAVVPNEAWVLETCTALPPGAAMADRQFTFAFWGQPSVNRDPFPAYTPTETACRARVCFNPIHNISKSKTLLFFLFDTVKQIVSFQKEKGNEQQKEKVIT